MRWGLTGLALAALVMFIVLPLAAVFVQAFEKGWHVYRDAIAQPETVSAIELSLLSVGISVPMNVLFGLAAAWAITKFQFAGKNVLTTLIDIPFGVSPVISGLVWVLVFGVQGWFGPWLMGHDIAIIFAVPGIILATTFVTFPFVAQRVDRADAIPGDGRRRSRATVLGSQRLANVFARHAAQHQMGPAVRNSALHGSSAGANLAPSPVVSGHIRGQTNTLPLHVEILYNEYNYARRVRGSVVA